MRLSHRPLSAGSVCKMEATLSVLQLGHMLEERERGERGRESVCICMCECGV